MFQQKFKISHHFIFEEKAKPGYMRVNIQVSQLWPRRSRSHWLNLIFHSSGTILRCDYMALWRISSRIKPQLPILFAHRAQELTTELACPPPGWLFPVPMLLSWDHFPQSTTCKEDLSGSTLWGKHRLKQSLLEVAQERKWSRWDSRPGSLTF